MPPNLYVNLPVKDLARSVDFFEALDFSFNPKFTNENAACLVINERTGVMLLVESYFAGFTNKPVADARASTETLLALSVSRVVLARTNFLSWLYRSPSVIFSLSLTSKYVSPKIP